MTARTKEYRIFEVDKYDNKWFEMSFSGDPEVQRRNAENYVANAVATGKGEKYEIVEV